MVIGEIYSHDINRAEIIKTRLDYKSARSVTINHLFGDPSIFSFRSTTTGA